MLPDRYAAEDRRSFAARCAQAASGSLAGILARIRELRRRHTPFVLCIVAHTEGSSYRKAGALALVTAGRRDGVISGGCLEADLEVHARRALAAGAPRAVVFDTMGDADLVFGSGSGCRGRMHVLILPDRPPHDVLVDALLAADEQHVPLDLALCMGLACVGRGMAWFGAAEVSIDGQFATVADVRAAPVGAHRFAYRGVDTCVARLRIGAVPRLLIIGAGPEAAPLLEMANGLGWRALLVDHRPAAVQALSELTDEVVVANPAAGLAHFANVPVDACLIMTHTAVNDFEALRAMRCHAVRYVGLLGPPRRRDELLLMLTDAEQRALEGRLRAPVGLHLGGHGPETLALGIAAELQQYFAELC